jgi:hypothetical protein
MKDKQYLSHHSKTKKTKVKKTIAKSPEIGREKITLKH